MRPGIVIREKRLIPVSTKQKNTKLEKIIGNIQRSTLRDEILVCAMVSPDGKTGVFLDDTGREYLIKEKELDEKITYISSKYVRKQVDKYAKAKKNASAYEDLVRDFITRPDTSKRYQDWVLPDGFDQEVEIPAVEEPKDKVEEEVLDEEQKYQKGKTYISKDGKWKFKVLGVKGGEIQILDLSTNLKCKVEVSDLEIMNPSLDEDEITSASIPAKKETITEEKLDESRIGDFTIEGTEVLYKGKPGTVENYDGDKITIKMKDGKLVKVDSIKDLKINESLDEGTDSYNGYKFKWRTANGEKNFEVTKNGKYCGTYSESEYDKVCKEINKGTFEKNMCEEVLDEEYNPFKDLKKLPEDTPMKSGLYTDGEGGVYEVPKRAVSKVLTVDGKKFQYSYQSKTLFELDKKGDYKTAHTFAISTWLDNPEYCCKVFLEKLDESGDFVKVSRNIITRLNKIALKYCGYKDPKAFTKFYDEIEKEGVEIDLITGIGDKSPSGGESWSVGWSLNGQKVENSKFVYQVYKPETGNKYEFNIYFS